MFGISGSELFLIIGIVLIIFGPDKLPQFGRTLGRFMREFKRAQDTMEATIRAEMHRAENDDLARNADKVTEAEAAMTPPAPAVSDESDDEEEDEE